MPEKIGSEAFLDTTQFEKGMNIYNKGLESMGKNTQHAAQTMSNAFSGAQVVGMSLAVMLGTQLSGAITNVVNQFKALTMASIGAVAEYERLSLSLETLIAKEYKQAGVAKDMTGALELATPAAKELIHWVELLAIKSPFDQAGVANALQTAVAYGFVTTAARSVEEAQEKGIVTAQRLTEALVNWAAGAGKSTFEMWRITYALGQVRTQGRLMRQDLMQLTTAGLDVNKILAEMGTNMADVTKANIDANDFISRVVKALEEDFGSAAERQADTISGLMNSMTDLRKIMLREFFGPIDIETKKMGGVLGAIKPLLQDFVNTFTNPEVINNVRALGMLLGEYVAPGIEFVRSALFGGNVYLEKFVGWIKELSPSLLILIGTIGFFVASMLTIATVTKIVNLAMTLMSGLITLLVSGFSLLISPIGLLTIALAGLAAVMVGYVVASGKDVGDVFTDIANKALDWGANIIENLATGMAQAAVAVINVLIWIGNAIASWLMPGSPPKIVPNVDKYGEGLVNAYIEGGMDVPQSTYDKLAADLKSKWDKSADKLNARERAAARDKATERVYTMPTDSAAPTATPTKKGGGAGIAGAKKLLRRYGADAMESIMAGWGKIDFSIFNDITGTMARYLRSLPEKVLPKEKLVPTLLGTREAVADAINTLRSTGQITEEMIDKIMKKAKGASDEFKNYVVAILETVQAQDALAAANNNLANAQDRVKQAQDDLNKVSDYYNDILDVLRGQLNAVTEGYQQQERLAQIQEAIASGRLTDEEKARLQAEAQGIIIQQQIKAVEQEKKLAEEAAQAAVDKAVEDETAAQVAVDAAEQQLALIQEQIDNSKSLIDVQAEQNSLIAEQIRLLEQLAKAAAAGAAGGGAGAPQIPEPPKVDSLVGGVDKALEGITNRIKDRFATMWRELLNDPNMKQLESKWQELQTTWNNTFGKISEWTKTPEGQRVAAWAGEMKVALDNTFGQGNFAAYEASQRLMYAKLGEGIALAVGLAWDRIKSAASTKWEEFRTEDLADFQLWIDNSVVKVNEWDSNTTKVIDGWISSHAEKFGKWVSDRWNNFGTFVNNANTKYTEFSTNANANIDTWINEQSTRFSQWVSDRWDNFGQMVNDANTKYTEFSTSANASIDTWITDQGTRFETWKNNLIGEGGVIPTAMSSMVDSIHEGIFGENGAIAKFRDFIDNVWDLFTSQETLGKWQEIGKMIIGNIISGLEAMWNNFTSTIAKYTTPGTGKGSTGGTGKTEQQATGGSWSTGRNYMVGEEGIEYLRAFKPGYIVSNDKILSAILGNMAKGLGISPAFGNVTNNRTVNLTINPRYEQYASPASIRHDVSAALAAARI